MYITNIHTYIETGRQTDRETDTHTYFTYRHTNLQTYTHEQINKHAYVSTYLPHVHLCISIQSQHTLHYITLLYFTLHHIRYIHYLHHGHPIFLLHITFTLHSHDIALHHITFNTLQKYKHACINRSTHHITLSHYVALHYVTLRYIALQNTRYATCIPTNKHTHTHTNLHP